MARPGVTPEGHFIPKHVAIVNHSTLARDEDIAVWTEAVSVQLREHCAPAWDEEPPGVSFIGSAEKIPPDQAAVVAFVDDDGNADSAGYHSDIAGLVYGLVDMGQSRIPSRTLSHEILELYGNARLDRTVPGPHDRRYYVELGDPVQRDGYPVKVTMFGDTHEVTVSDFVLPAWFGLGPGRTTYMGRSEDLDPFEVAAGGYQLAETPDGEILYLSQGLMAMNRSGHSRTDRIRRRKFARVA